MSFQEQTALVQQMEEAKTWAATLPSQEMKPLSIHFDDPSLIDEQFLGYYRDWQQESSVEPVLQGMLWQETDASAAIPGPISLKELLNRARRRPREEQLEDSSESEHSSRRARV